MGCQHCLKIINHYIFFLLLHLKEEKKIKISETVSKYTKENTAKRESTYSQIPSNQAQSNRSPMSSAFPLLEICLVNRLGSSNCRSL